MTKTQMILVAIAVAVVPLALSAQDIQPLRTGSYAIVTSGQNPTTAWRINTTSGTVSVCYAAGQDTAPRCTPWSENYIKRNK